ncbi:hypothetical protein GLO73106DRAFT_00004060 [Gloeocapsa sp. PCC 73106]|nr:hypothetical protein GLO73106DRAFT_00004060 [Gloeocapsa sp. PCC 73106]
MQYNVFGDDKNSDRVFGKINLTKFSILLRLNSKKQKKGGSDRPTP